MSGGISLVTDTLTAEGGGLPRSGRREQPWHTQLSPSTSFFRAPTTRTTSSSAFTLQLLMAFHRTTKPKPKSRSSIIFLVASIAAIGCLFLFSSLISTNGFSLSFPTSENNVKINNRYETGHEKYLYWGNIIDCPGKHCDSCEGLGHQESSLRCALEEALFLQRYSLTDWFLFSFFCNVFRLYLPSKAENFNVYIPYNGD